MLVARLDAACLRLHVCLLPAAGGSTSGCCCGIVRRARWRASDSALRCPCPSYGDPPEVAWTPQKWNPLLLGGGPPTGTPQKLHGPSLPPGQLPAACARLPMVPPDPDARLQPAGRERVDSFARQTRTPLTLRVQRGRNEWASAEEGGAQAAASEPKAWPQGRRRKAAGCLALVGRATTV